MARCATSGRPRRPGRSGRWLLVGLLALVGCGYEESYSGLGDRALPGDPLRPEIPTVHCQDACVCQGGGGGGETDGGELAVADLTGRGYRFATLAISKPLPDYMAELVNGFFTDEIAKGTLNVVLRVDADDREAGTLEARLGNATLDEEAYALDEAASPLHAALDGTLLTTTADSSLHFPTSVLEPPYMPVTKLRISGKFTTDGEGIDAGTLSGALLATDAAEIKMGGVVLAEMLLSLAPLDLDSDGDGTLDAWQFLGTFTAARVTLVAGGAQ